MSDRPRVVLALPETTEAAILAEWLAAGGCEPVRRVTARAATEEMQTRPFDLLIADATLALRDRHLAASRGRNPLTPAVVIGSAAPSKEREVQNRQAMYLVRPLERAILICTISMAILEGRPTRRSVRKLVNRFDAVVSGVSSHIIDVSNEGLRLEMPRERQSAPPPYFSVHLPFIGVAITAQRMWARVWPGSRRPVTWCGAALAQDRSQAERASRMFVDTVPVAGQNSSWRLQLR